MARPERALGIVTPHGPAFSVIIPCYNLGQYIDEAVDSVLAQTFQDFEIVIVNDGSTDPFTNELLANYRRPKTRVLTTENRGVSAARNLAIEHSKGKYISAVDADDKIEPTYFEKAFRILEADEGVAWVSSWLRTFGDEDWVWKQERCDLATLLGECTVLTAAPVRRTALQAVGGYDSRLLAMEDWELWINLAVHGFRGVIIPEVLFHYRRRAGSLTTTTWLGGSHLELFEQILVKHRAAYEEHQLDLLSRKDAICCDVLKATYGIERRIHTLTDQIALKEKELARLESKAALPWARSSTPQVRSTASWRRWKLVAPLRWAYRLLKRMSSPAISGSTPPAADLRS
jgi:glycosyltransferase involved in cell wall biosynthesis